MQPISLYLVDGQTIVRQGVRCLLENHKAITVVGETAFGEVAIEEIPKINPDIVLLELSLSGISGIEIVKTLKETQPAIRSVALSIYDDADHLQLFMKVGGNGYVPKSASEKQLFDTLTAVSRGEHYAPAHLLADLAKKVVAPSLYNKAKLTPREYEVVRSLAKGYTHKEIAIDLGVSRKTVATYRERAIDKLGFKKRTELVRWALKENMLSA